MLRRVALVRTDVSEKLSASIIRVTRIDELGTLAMTRIGEIGITLAGTSNRRKLVTANVPSSPIIVILMMEVLCSSETCFLTRDNWHNISE
jgi:hypothetical protein